MEKFGKGTYSWWSKLLGPGGVGNQIIKFVDQSLIPTLDTIMVRAFGHQYQYKKLGADLTPILQGGILSGFEFKTIFIVDVLKGFDGNDQDVEDDTEFFYDSLRKLRGIQVKEDSVFLDTESGRITFKMMIPLQAV